MRQPGKIFLLLCAVVLTSGSFNGLAQSAPSLLIGFRAGSQVRLSWTNTPPGGKAARRFDFPGVHHFYDGERRIGAHLMAEQFPNAVRDALEILPPGHEMRERGWSIGRTWARENAVVGRTAGLSHGREVERANACAGVYSATGIRRRTSFRRFVSIRPKVSSEIIGQERIELDPQFLVKTNPIGEDYLNKKKLAMPDPENN